jgi:IMP dehydrogenase
METVTDGAMAFKMAELGGIGIIHRFQSIQSQVNSFINIWPKYTIPCAVGVNGDSKQRLEALYNVGCRVFCVDVAHGDSINVLKFIDWLGSYEVEIIAGSVATVDGALRLAELGVDSVRVGIGGGAACTTRIVTGFGVPLLQSIMDISTIKDRFPNLKIIADGGIRGSGDIAKSIAAGADTVMIGRLLAGCDESPLPGRYYGQASLAANPNNLAPEGESGIVPLTGSVSSVVDRLMAGLRSSISYSGGESLDDLRSTQFIRVNSTTMQESHTRF